MKTLKKLMTIIVSMFFIISCSNIETELLPKEIKTSLQSLTFTEQAYEKVFSITSSEKPYVSVTDNWLSVETGIYNNGKTFVKVRVKENTTTEMREAFIYISCARNGKKVKVFQSAGKKEESSEEENNNDDEEDKTTEKDDNDSSEDKDIDNGPPQVSFGDELIPFALEREFAVGFEVTSGNPIKYVEPSPGVSFSSVDISDDGLSGKIVLKINTGLSIINKNFKKNIYFTDKFANKTKAELNLKPVFIKILEDKTIVTAETSEFTLPVESFLTAGELKINIESDNDWLSYSATNVTELGSIRFSAKKNETGSTRKAVVTVFDTYELLSPVSFEILQEELNERVEGHVWFEDADMRRALAMSYDYDGNNQISFEEALTVENMDISNLGLTSIVGIEAFKNIKSLYCYGNEMENIDLSCDLRFLGEIRCDERIYIDVTGCRFVLRLNDKNGDPVITSYMKKIIKLDGQMIKMAQFGSVLNVEHNYNWESVYDNRKSTDFSQDKKKVVLQEATKTQRPKEIIFMGCNFLDVDVESGAYHEAMMDAYETMFALEPMKSLREYVKVSYFVFVEEQRTHTDYGWNLLPRRQVEAIERGYENIPGCNQYVCYVYATDKGRSSAYRNGCHGDCVARYDNNFAYVVNHELVGHLIGDLDDEYVDSEWAAKRGYNENTRHMGNNTTWDNRPENLPWAWKQFYFNQDYKNEIGIYQGAYYLESHYRPSEKSIMRSGQSFDAVGRWHIYENIKFRENKSTLMEKFTEFLEYDKKNINN